MKEIIWQPKARRQLKKLRDAKATVLIVNAVETLVFFPDVQEIRALVNHQCTHRLRVGPYRVLFNAFDAINVISIEEVKKEMSALTNNYQTIEYNGEPAFVLVPVDEFRKMRPLLENEAVKGGIPHSVVRANLVDSVPMIKAWREHLGMTQDELAGKAGMSQPALAKLEKPGARPRKATIRKVAEAMGLSVDQVEE